MHNCNFFIYNALFLREQLYRTKRYAMKELRIIIVIEHQSH